MSQSTPGGAVSVFGPILIDFGRPFPVLFPGFSKKVKTTFGAYSCTLGEVQTLEKHLIFDPKNHTFPDFFRGPPREVFLGGPRADLF